MKTKKILGILMLAAMLAGAAVAQPDLMNYQGRLMDSGGAPVNGSVPVTVRVYAQESGGSVLWNQSVGSVAVTNGLYSFQFGNSSLTTVLTNAACWLEIEVDSETLTPRQRLVSVPYSARAKEADAAVTAQTATTATTANSATTATTANTATTAGYATTAATATNALQLGGRTFAQVIPPGTIWAYAGTTEPSGWKFCNGTVCDRVATSNLFAVIGTTYGAGDGSTTYNVPDLRGRVIAGRDGMGASPAGRLTNVVAGATLGAAGGAEGVTLTVNQIPSHLHSNAMSRCGQTVTGYGLTTASSFQNNVMVAGGPGFNSASEGGGQSHPNVQPTIVLNYIIKY